MTGKDVSGGCFNPAYCLVELESTGYWDPGYGAHSSNIYINEVKLDRLNFSNDGPFEVHMRGLSLVTMGYENYQCDVINTTTFDIQYSQDTAVAFANHLNWVPQGINHLLVSDLYTTSLLYRIFCQNQKSV